MKNKKSKKNKRIIPKQKGGVTYEEGEIIFGIFIWALGLYCLFYIARCRCLSCCIESGVRVAVTDSVHDVERGSPSPPPSHGSAGMSANRRNESMIAFANNLQSETRENLRSANRRTDSMIAFADNLRSEPGQDLRSATDEENDDTIMLPVAKKILKVIAQPLPSADETLDTVIATEMLWLVHSANTPENLLKEINNIMPAAIIIRGLTDSVDAQLSHIRNQITSQNQHETRRTGGGKALSSETRPPSLAAAAAARAHTRSPFLSSFFRAATRPRRFRRTAVAAAAAAAEPAAEKKAIMTMMDRDIDYYIDYYIDKIINVSNNNEEKFLKNINGFIKNIVLILMRQRRYMVPEDAKEILPEIAKEILEDKMKNYGMKTPPSGGGKKTCKKRKKSCKKTRRKSSKQRHRKKRRTRR